MIDQGTNEFYQGKAYNYPEINCCACSAGQHQHAEQSYIAGSCTHKSTVIDKANTQAGKNAVVARCKTLSKFGCDEAWSTCEWVDAFVCRLKAAATENDKPCAWNHGEAACEASQSTAGSNCEWVDENHVSAATQDDTNKPAAEAVCDEEPSAKLGICTHQAAFKTDCDAIYECKLENYEGGCSNHKDGACVW